MTFRLCRFCTDGQRRAPSPASGPGRARGRAETTILTAPEGCLARKLREHARCRQSLTSKTLTMMLISPGCRGVRCGNGQVLAEPGVKVALSSSAMSHSGADVNAQPDPRPRPPSTRNGALRVQLQVRVRTGRGSRGYGSTPPGRTSGLRPQLLGHAHVGPELERASDGASAEEGRAGVGIDGEDTGGR